MIGTARSYDLRPPPSSPRRIDFWLPRKVDQARWESGNLPREEEAGIRLMEGDGVGRDGVPWVDVSLEPSTGRLGVSSSSDGETSRNP